ncbi:two-component system, chemotaxis family, CheB/CheR fusion protein [Candidatus Magnetomoraceae bacterium gMMP-13]
MEKKTGPRHIPVVGIGASAGGLDAFKNLFESMPSDTGMAFVLIQHLDPTHESLMVDLLSRHTNMKVVQVEDRMRVKVNHIFVIPPNRDITIHNGELYLSEPLQRRGLQMPIDFFFKSLAEDQREQAICIILSGTGSDGTLGLKAIKSYGGMVMTQSPKTAQYDGMLVSAISTGAVDYVLPVTAMPNALLKYIQHSYIRGRFGTDEYKSNGGQDLNNVLAIMHAQLGHNFHHYKKNTLFRRVQRRMSLKQFEKMSKYVIFIRNNPDETKELFKDMLIGVTGFFRDNESWDVLENKLISQLIKNKKEDASLRVWVPGCASGEEAYTIAILFMENFKRFNKRANLQIFATDIDTNALEHARIGRYPEGIATDLSPARLHEFFVKEDDFYKVSNRLRDNIVFSEQNLISDPPFSKLDLISCRNLLIYLEADVQSRVFELFHFALREGGHLMLGNSETIGQHYDIFETISKKWRLFQRIDSARLRRATFPILPSRQIDRLALQTTDITKRPVRLSELINQALLHQYAPASILINRKHEILYHFGNTVDYLHYPTGEPTNDLYVVARDGLITRLRGTIHKAIKDRQDIVVTGARVKRNGKYARIKFSVRPLKKFEGGEGLLLISFEEDKKKIGKSIDNIQPSAEEEPLVKQLEYELSATKEDLQNTIEELETSNEELKASNEEIMSMNEELQSSNEELETSKEELQSLNEELSTVNNELQDKVGILEQTNNDLNNLINSTNMAVIFLNTKFHINFFTPAGKKLFNLIATDIGRSLDDITPKFNDPDLRNDSETVLDTLRIIEKAIQNDEGKWYNRKILPYRTHDNRIEGIVLTFEEITRLKENQMEVAAQFEKQTKDLNQKNKLLLNKFSSPHVMTLHLDCDYNILAADKLFIKTYGLKSDNLIAKNYFTLFPKAASDKKIFEKVLKTGEVHFIFAKSCELFKVHPEKLRSFDWAVKPLKESNGRVTGILLSIIEVTK